MTEKEKAIELWKMYESGEVESTLMCEQHLKDCNDMLIIYHGTIIVKYGEWEDLKELKKDLKDAVAYHEEMMR